MNGPFALAVAISDTVDDGITSDIVWVSSAALVDDQTTRGLRRAIRTSS